MALILVAIDNFHEMRVPARPLKADAPLIVDANGVLPLSAAGKLFKPIRGRNSQVIQIRGSAQHDQFPPGSQLDMNKSANTNPALEPLRLCAPERLDQRTRI